MDIWEGFGFPKLRCFGVTFGDPSGLAYHQGICLGATPSDPPPNSNPQWSRYLDLSVHLLVDLSVDPSADPSVDSSVDPPVDPSMDPPVDPPVDPSVDPSVDLLGGFWWMFGKALDSQGFGVLGCFLRPLGSTVSLGGFILGPPPGPSPKF